jgi:exonuclease III
LTGNNRHLSILTLSVNGLNAQIKTHRIAKGVKKEDPIICCLKETHLTAKKKKILAYSQQVEKSFPLKGIP